MKKIPDAPLKQSKCKNIKKRQEETHSTEGAWPMVSQDQFAPHMSEIHTYTYFIREVQFVCDS